MPPDAAAVIEAYWAAAEERDWRAFASLLADDVLYEVPQTRERIRGRDAYVQFNVEYPVTVERAVGSGAHGASWTTFTVDDDVMPGLCFFDLDDAGRIARLADFWPEPYDPPPGREHLVERW